MKHAYSVFRGAILSVHTLMCAFFDQSVVISAARQWVARLVIGYNLCLFEIIAGSVFVVIKS